MTTSPGTERRLWFGLAAVTAVWSWVFVRLTVTPVWDELGLLPPSGLPLLDQLRRAWTTFRVFRPLPVTLLVAVRAALPAWLPDWIALRAVTAACVLASVLIFVRLLCRLGCPDPVRRLLFAATVMLGASGVIVAAWFPNLYDAAVLLLVACGFSLVAAGRPAAAGVALGAAFFCKESAAFAMPVLAALAWRRAVARAAATRCAAVTVAIAALYFLLRNRATTLGGPGDIHGFHAADLLPSLGAFAVSFWGQTAVFAPVWLAGAALVGVLVASRSSAAAATLAAIVATGTIVYLGMLRLDPQPVIHWATFGARLYFVPVALAAFALALWGTRAALAIALVPALVGGWQEARRYLRFQEAYATINRIARQAAPAPLYVRVDPASGLLETDDPASGAHVGDYPEARWELSLADGTVVPRTPPSDGVPHRGVRLFTLEPPAYPRAATRRGGAVDSVTRRGSTVVVLGWAPLEDTERHQRLLAILPAGAESRTVSEVARPDVVARYGREALAHSGFRLELRFRDEGTADRAARGVCVLARSESTPPTLLAAANPACRGLLAPGAAKAAP